MALILTFLGKGGTGRTTIAIAAAKRLASQGQRVLFASQESAPVLECLLGLPVATEAQEIEPNLHAVQFQTTQLLEKSWEEVKQLEAQYVRTPFFKEVYGQELGVLPGMDVALSMNAVREYNASGRYDAIVYDGASARETLRILGTPEIFGWYLRRFRQVIADSDLGRALSPFVQPATNAVLNVDWSQNDFSEPTNRLNSLLDEGKSAIADPNRMAGYLVTTADPAAIAAARYWWGSAQQVGLTVGGVLLNRADSPEAIASEFAPLNAAAIPQRQGDSWQSAIDALPDFRQAANAPKPIVVDLQKRQVRLFLPGFDKKQVKLMQYGPEVTIEAGDQRRNIFLPDALSGKAVTSAKFQDRYLTISFAER